jgi:hypothetical protein
MIVPHLFFPMRIITVDQFLYACLVKAFCFMKQKILSGISQNVRCTHS